MLYVILCLEFQKGDGLPKLPYLCVCVCVDVRPHLPYGDWESLLSAVTPACEFRSSVMASGDRGI